MKRTLSACLLTFALPLMVHGQNFDPAYKPEPGDVAVVGFAVTYGAPLKDEFNSKYVFLGCQAFASLDGIRGTGKLSGNLEVTPTYLIPSAPRYRLKAGTKVKIIAKTRTIPIIFFSVYVQDPVYEIELMEDPFIGKHAYISGSVLQQKAKHTMPDWDDQAEAIHTAVVYEADNPEFALGRYMSAYMFGSKSRLGQLAKAKLVEAGMPVPFTPADLTPAMVDQIKEKLQEELEKNKSADQPGFSQPARPTGSARSTRPMKPAERAEAPDDQSITILDCNYGPAKYQGVLNVYRITATLENTTGQPLKFLQVTAIFKTANFRLLHTEWTYASPRLIQPGETATVEIMTRENLDEISRFDLKFECNGKEIKYRKTQLPQEQGKRYRQSPGPRVFDGIDLSAGAGAPVNPLGLINGMTNAIMNSNGMRSPTVGGHYCGAMTLQGTPCARWVVNGLYCYEHGG